MDTVEMLKILEENILISVAQELHETLIKQKGLHSFLSCGSNTPCRKCDGRAVPWDELDEDKQKEVISAAKTYPGHKIYMSMIELIDELFLFLNDD